MNKYNKKEALSALKDALPIAIGYIPIALAFGIISKTNQLSLLDCFLFSFMVFAGASQFIAVNLISSAVSGFQIILTTAIMNSRHFLMSASLSTKIKSPRKKLLPLVAFGVTDETFSVLATKNKELSVIYSLVVNTTAYFSWVLGSVTGYLLGSFLPDAVQASMKIALYSMFIAILVPSMKKSKEVVILALLSGGIHTFLNFTNFIPQDNNLIISIILASLLGLIILPKEDEGEVKS
ncbi:MAG TPA: AzlC family ABC transporter permease [Defluviitaleaceae bacterium]|nr:AzlC family ABC transporter permease [Defluviitaleaceae bacterium]